jgi:hypothetical protein
VLLIKRLVRRAPTVSDPPWLTPPPRAPQTTLTFLSDVSRPPATSPFDKRAAIVAMSALDCVGALAFLGGCLLLIVVSRRLCAEVRAAPLVRGRGGGRRR